ncbi:MAG: dTDP-4-dehydrorhamnose 3,5-epimerase family protein [Microgenomates group bacterium]
MKILSKAQTLLPGVVLFSYSRFKDERGYFSEIYNKKELHLSNGTDIVPELLQSNESFSKKNVVRGLHFQWNPFMGKLIRTAYGHMIDLVLDIRPDSKTYGKGIMVDMPGSQESETDQLLWIPPGFAHGNLFLENTLIQYFCTGTYNPQGEVGIYPYSADIDWSLSEKSLYEQFSHIKQDAIMSPKDKKGISLAEWIINPNAKQFQISK